MFKLDLESLPATAVKNIPSVKLDDNNDNLTVSNKDFSFIISKESGLPTSFIYKGEELLKGAIKPNFWRAPTLNDDVDHNALPKWLNANLNALTIVPRHMTANTVNNSKVVVTVILDFNNEKGETVLSTEQVYEINGYADVVISKKRSVF